MVNNKGLLRIIEASIAILIVLVVLLVVTIDRRQTVEVDPSDILYSFIEQLAQNFSFRDKVFNDREGAIEDVMSYLNEEIKNPFLKYDVLICDNYKDICSMSAFPENVDGGIYSEERIISTSLETATLEPKKLKIFLWRIKN